MTERLPPIPRVSQGDTAGAADRLAAAGLPDAGGRVPAEDAGARPVVAVAAPPGVNTWRQAGHRRARDEGKGWLHAGHNAVPAGGAAGDGVAIGMAAAWPGRS
jgi:hypothetical protein